MSNTEWLQREATVLTRASHRIHDPKFGPVFCRGEGAVLWDVEGQDYLDFTCGYSASSFGHAFPPLVEVAQRQIAQLTHLTQEPHIFRAPLAEKLVALCGFDRSEAAVHFNATGARAVETAWKASRAYRPGKLISLAPSYHGRSLATSALSDVPAAPGDMPAAPGDLPAAEKLVPLEWHSRRPVSEFPYCSACSLGLTYPTCDLRCLDKLLDQIVREAQSVSAVIVEPALGARGYVFPPAEYWQRLRRVTTELGITLIADEIQMGLGRAGAMLLSHSQGWQADLVLLGKSLGGGIVPISAVVGRREVLDALPIGSESETFACTPLAAAVALEVLQQLSDSSPLPGGAGRIAGSWIERGCEVGKQLRETLQSLGESHFHGMHVEGQGATAIAEFIHRDRALETSQNVAMQFAVACHKQRILVHFTGPFSTRIALIPPLNTTAQELKLAKDRFQAVAEEIKHRC